jgi:hypothetical protein
MGKRAGPGTACPILIYGVIYSVRQKPDPDPPGMRGVNLGLVRISDMKAYQRKRCHKRLRFVFLNLAGRVVHHARTIQLRLSALLDRITDMVPGIRNPTRHRVAIAQSINLT